MTNTQIRINDDTLTHFGWRFAGNETGEHNEYTHAEFPGHSIAVVSTPDTDHGFWMHDGDGDHLNAGNAAELAGWLSRFHSEVRA